MVATSPKTIALAGNPNCGKTTLFNLLTGATEQVGNRPGVTFALKKAPLRLGEKDAVLTDLPGTYSLTPFSGEEKIADEYLQSGDADLVIDVADATNLERSLLLTLELIRRGLRVVLALNMMDEAKKEGVRIDGDALSRALGVPVVPISAAKREGISELIGTAFRPLAASPLAKTLPPTTQALLAIAADLTRRYVISPGGASLSGDRIDRVVCRPLFGIPIFASLLFFVFWLTFSGVGKSLSDLLGNAVTALCELLVAGLARVGVGEVMLRFLSDGVFAGIGAVLSFLPQTALLFFLLELMEDSGIMARVAFMTDALLRPLGLSGKAFIPMLLSFGCAVPATMSATALDDSEKETVVSVIPFLPCSARLPVFVMLIGTFFPRHGALAALSLYLLGIGVALLFAWFRTKRDAKAPPLTIELPKYRMPQPKNLTRFIGIKLRDFIRRAGTVVFLSCVVVSLMRTLTPAFHVAAAPQDSLLYAIGQWFAPLFAPIGLNMPEIVAALFTGFFAKESIVSTMRILCGASLSARLSQASAVSLMLFSLLYTPCAATLAAIRREIGTKKAALVLLRCLVTAYAIAFLGWTFFRIFARFA